MRWVCNMMCGIENRVYTTSQWCVMLQMLVDIRTWRKEYEWTIIKTLPIRPKLQETVRIFFGRVFLFHPAIWNLDETNGKFKRRWGKVERTYQWKIAFHGAAETLSILFWRNNCGLPLARPTKECRFFHPALQFLVPSISTDII